MTRRPKPMRSQRGTLTEPGQNSPFRYRSVEENLDLFRRMRAGEFPNGARVLRAKIDMASGNMNLRDPVLYRILHAHHPRTGDAWSHLPDLRFRPRPVGRDRAHHPQRLHAGVRGPSAAVRLADREPAGPVPPAAVRVRPAERQLHRAVEAPPDPAGHREPRQRLGRPAHADPRRHPAARRPGRGAARIHQPRRRRPRLQHRSMSPCSTPRSATR